MSACHECKHFLYDDIRSWPMGECKKIGVKVSGLKVKTMRLKPVSRVSSCSSFDPKGEAENGFPLTMEEYSLRSFEWDE